MSLDDALTGLKEFVDDKFSDDVIDSGLSGREFWLVATLQSLPTIIDSLRTNRISQFRTLIDITAVDYPGRDVRFDLVYHFLSMKLNIRVRIKASIKEAEIAPSITHIFPAANWFEREVFDMYGIMFGNHPDLRRLLTDYGFQGHPLRKDFPTTGFVELRYDEEKKKVVYDPVKLSQEYRTFDFMSPWEGYQMDPPKNWFSKEEDLNEG